MKAAIACPQGIKSAKADPCCFREVSDKMNGLLSMDKDRIENQNSKGHKSKRYSPYSQHCVWNPKFPARDVAVDSAFCFQV